MPRVRSSPWVSAAAITVSDAGSETPESAFLASVSVAGAVKVRLSTGNDMVLTLPVGTTILPLAVTRVWTTGTTATGTYYNMS